MSGFEMSGLVLGAFPILVQAFGQIGEALEVAKACRRYRTRLNSYAGILETQQVIYSETLEELLGGIVSSEKEVSLLVNDPRGPHWKDLKYERQLRDRLDRSYDRYCKGTKEIRDVLEDFQ